MKFHRLVPASFIVAAAALNGCGAEPASDADVQSVSSAVTIQKSYPRKIYVHIMPWFQVGGQHWSMNSRNAGTGVAAWYKPMIGEYSSNDGNVIEYQLLTMKYAGIDGVIIDWPGLNGGYDRPQNKANSDAIIAKTAQFGLEFAVCYEDQYADSADAAKADMAYVRDQFMSKANHIKVNGAPMVMVFGPQKFKSAGDWSNILSVFSSKPSFFPLWYNDSAGANANGKFAWIAQNALKGLNDFDNGLDGVDHGNKVPVLYPGFNPYYAAGGWPGPTWKISYKLKADNTEGQDGDTLATTFELGKFAGEPLQIATWNDYGEGTMVEPTNEFQYTFLQKLQQSVGAVYTDAELKIVKMLFDGRRANKPQMDEASADLAKLDVAAACKILGCTAPVHMGAGGGSGTSGAPGTAGSTGVAGAHAGTGGTGSAGAPNGSGGAPTSGAGTNNTAGTAGKPANSAGSTAAGGASSGEPQPVEGGSKCSVTTPGAQRSGSTALLIAAGALMFAGGRRRRRLSA